MAQLFWDPPREINVPQLSEWKNCTSFSQQAKSSSRDTHGSKLSSGYMKAAWIGFYHFLKALSWMKFPRQKNITKWQSQATTGRNRRNYAGHFLSHCLAIGKNHVECEHQACFCSFGKFANQLAATQTFLPSSSIRCASYWPPAWLRVWQRERNSATAGQASVTQCLQCQMTSVSLCIC